MKKFPRSSITTLFLTALLACTSGSIASAQKFQASKGTDCSQDARSVFPLTSGGYAVAGESGLSGNCPSNQAFIIKFDEGGNQVWGYSYTLGGASKVTKIFECAGGDLAVCGAVTNATGCAGSTHPFILRLTSCGITRWAKVYSDASYTGEATDMIETVSGDPFNGNVPTAIGDFVLVGWVLKTIDHVPMDHDAFMFRVDGTNGTPRWIQEYDLGNSDDFFNAVVEARFNNPPAGAFDLIAVGQTNINGSIDGLVARIDGNNGTLNLPYVFSRGLVTVGTSERLDAFTSVQELQTLGPQQGHIIAAGYSLPPADSPGIGHSSQDMYIAEISPDPCDGIISDLRIWNGSIASIREVTGSSVLNNGNLVITGSYTDPSAFPTNTDAFLTELRTAPLSPVAPTRLFGGTLNDEGHSIMPVIESAPCTSAGFAIAGFTRSLGLNSLADLQQAYVIKTDAARTSGCNERLVNNTTEVPGYELRCQAASRTQLHIPCSPLVLRKNQCWLNTDLCYASDGTSNCSTRNCTNCGIVPKTDVEDESEIASPAVEDKVMEIFPNPVGSSGEVTVQYTTSIPATLLLTVIDMSGREIARSTFEVKAGVQTLPLHTSGWTSGSYMVKISGDGTTTTRRLVVGR